MKKLVLIHALLLTSIGAAAAQSQTPNRLPTASAVAANTPAMENCEAQLRRLAESNKTLAANFDAGRVQDVCIAEDGASGISDRRM